MGYKQMSENMNDDLLSLIGIQVENKRYKDNYNKVLEQLNDHNNNRYHTPDEDENDTWENLTFCYQEDLDPSDPEYDMMNYISNNDFTYSQLNASGMGDYLYTEYTDNQVELHSGGDIDDDTHNYIENLLFKVGYL